MSNEPKQNIFVFVDTETTGLHLTKHGIIQIGAYATGETLSDFKGYFVRDCAPTSGGGDSTDIEIDPSALAINGFTAGRIFDSKPTSHVMWEFADFLIDLEKKNSAEATLVFHAAKFDAPRLEIAAERTCVSLPWMRRVLCTITQGFVTYGETLSLDKLAEKCGVSNGMKHDALADAITTAGVFHHLREICVSRFN